MKHGDPFRVWENLLWLIVAFALFTSFARADTNTYTFHFNNGADTVVCYVTRTVTPGDVRYPGYPGSVTTSLKAVMSGNAGDQVSFGFITTISVGIPYSYNGVYYNLNPVFNYITSQPYSGSPPSLSLDSSAAGIDPSYVRQGNSTLTGSNPSYATVSFQDGTIPDQFLDLHGMATIAMVQNGQIVDTTQIYAGPGSSTQNITFANATSGAPYTLDLVLPGYSNNANGGLVQTGNVSNTALVALPSSNGSTVFTPPVGGGSNATPAIELGANYFASVLPGISTGSNSTLGLVSSSPIQPVWSATNGSAGLTAGTFQQGISQEIAAIGNANSTNHADWLSSQTLLSQIANNTANISSGGGGSQNITVDSGNLSDDGTHTRLDTLNSTVNSGFSNTSALLSNISNNLSALNTTSNSTGNFASQTLALAANIPSNATMSTLGAAAAANLTSQLPNDVTFSGTSAAGGSPSSAFDITFPAIFGGQTIHTNPFSYPAFVTLFSWLRTAEAWLIVILFGLWSYTDFNRQVTSAFYARQARGNAVLGGTGGQATSLAAAAGIATAIGVMIVGLVAVWDTQSASLSYNSFRLLDPFSGLSSDIFWFIDQTFPCATAISALTLRLAWKYFAIPFEITVRAIILFLVP